MDIKTSNFFIKYGFGSVIAVIIVIVTLLFSNKVDGIIESKIASEFNASSALFIGQVEEAVGSLVTLYNTSAGLFGASEYVSREEWFNFLNTKKVLSRYPEIQSVGYIERVDHAHKDAFIEKVRAEGFSDFVIKPEGQRDQYYVVNYLEPVEGNEAAFGFDLGSNPNRLEALEEARDRNRFSITSPISLVQDNEASPAFLGAIPIYVNGSKIDSVTERRENLQGYISAVFKAEDLFLKNDFDNVLRYLHVTARDAEEGSIFFSNDEVGRIHPELRFAGSIETGSRKWDVEIFPTDLFYNRFQSDILLARTIPYAGGVLAVIVFVLFYIIGRSRSMAFLIADKMTDSYKKEKEKVLSQKAELEEALKETKKSQEIAENKVKEAEKLNSVMLGREMKILELKKKITELEEKVSEKKD